MLAGFLLLPLTSGSLVECQDTAKQTAPYRTNLSVLLSLVYSLRMFGYLSANTLHSEYAGNALLSHRSVVPVHTKKPLSLGSRGKVLHYRRSEKSVSSYIGRQHGLEREQLRLFSLHSSKPLARSQRSDTACRASASETATQKSHDLGLTLQANDSIAAAPILSGAGGGIFFWWQLGEQLISFQFSCAYL